MLYVVAGSAEERIEAGRFSQNDMSGWEAEVFSGQVHYQLVHEDRTNVLRAQSSNAASGLVHRMDIDLDHTPYLNWSWKVSNTLRDNDEQTRRGDDYPARIYVVFSGGVFFWRTRAINYVWSSHQPVDTLWPNAYTHQARMIAVDSGDTLVGQWVSHRRNVRDDYKQLFGEYPGKAGAVAIMSDTDNTGQTVTAWYGDIWFSDK